MHAPGGGAASDVHGLLLGRQQSVHGSRHRLHVNLRAEADVSRRGGSGPRAGGEGCLPPGVGVKIPPNPLLAGACLWEE